MTARVVAVPKEPKLLAKLDAWAGEVGAEIELEACEVRWADFAATERFEAESCRFIGVQFAGAAFKKFQLSDSVIMRSESAAAHAPKAAWLRVVVKDSRLTGADFGEATFEDCVFENAKIDESGFRFATFKRVRFENCVLRNADFSSAKLTNVSFSGCDLEGTNFDNASCKSVNLRGENLSAIKGIHGLKGATISSEQLIQLAPILAAELGLDVDYET